MQYAAWLLFVATCQVAVKCVSLSARSSHLSLKGSDHPDGASKIVTAKRAERWPFQLKNAEVVIHSSSMLGNGSVTQPMNTNDAVDLQCIRMTGGKCATSGCKADRGPTECVHDLCICPLGFCASAQGQCEKGQGEKIGEFAIRFMNPYNIESPYMGIVWSRYFRSYVLDMVADGAPQWRGFLSHDGFVRLESMTVPGMVLSKSRVDGDSKGIKLIQKSSIDSPATVNLQVNKVNFNGAMEIWIPAADRPGAVSSWGHKSGLLAPRLTVSLCDNQVFVPGLECGAHTSVQFEPAFPSTAVSNQGRAIVTPIANLYAWQARLLLVVVVALCVSACYWFYNGGSASCDSCMCDALCSSCF